MRKVNDVVVVGNLGADPEERAAEKNGPVVRFSIAQNIRRYNEEKKIFETIHTNWFPVVCFGPLATRVKANLKKGDLVSLSGSLRSDSYTNKKGEQRSGIQVVAYDVQRTEFLKMPGTQDSGEMFDDAISSSIPF